MQTSVECPVCINVYAPRTRPPKILVNCGHGLCEPCVHTLLSAANGSSINCPKCRTNCEIPEGKPEKLPTMYPLLELIDSLCGECRDRPHTQRCGHCPLNLCDECRDVHLRGASSNFIDGIKELEKLTDKVSLNLAHRKDIQIIQVKGAKIKSSLKQALEEQIRLLKAEHEKKIAAVDAEIIQHTDMVMEWRRNARQLCAECDTLLDKLRYIQDNVTQGMDAIKEQDQTHQHELQEKIAALKQVQSSKPDSSNVQFNIIIDAIQSITLTGEVSHEMSSRQQTGSDDVITCKSEQCTDPDDVIPVSVLMPDYPAAVVQATFDEQISFPNGICEDPTTGRIYATDLVNNEVVVLTPGLELVRRLRDTGIGHEYNSPSGVQAARGFLYVSDQCNHRIIVTGLQGIFCHSIGSQGSGKEHYRLPLGLSMDRVGLLYVCDTGNRRVKVVSAPSGVYIREFGRDVLDGDPCFIAIYSASDVVAVSTTTGDNIYLFTTEGQHINTIKTKGPLHNIEAEGVVFDRFGHLLVSDRAGGRVAVMKQDGEVVGYLGSSGSSSGQLKGPWGLTVTNEGNVVVCDKGNARVLLFNVPKKET